MKRSWFSEEQIIGILKERRAGLLAGDLCRKHGQRRHLLELALEVWRMQASEAKRLKALEEENKKLLAKSMLDAATLKDHLAKKLLTPGARRSAVNWAIEEKNYSQVRACALIGLAPKTHRYQAKRDARSESQEARRRRLQRGSSQGQVEFCWMQIACDCFGQHLHYL